MNLRSGPGIYDTLLDQTLADLLFQYPELRTVFGKLESEEQPSRYAEFVSKVLKQALREEPDPEKRLALCNHIIDLPAGRPGLRLLMPGFEDLRDRRVPVRVITTSYMGASDAPAIEWLAHHLPNVQIRVSYDTRPT